MMMRRALLVGLVLLTLLAHAQEEGKAGFTPLFTPVLKSELPEEVKLIRSALSRFSASSKEMRVRVLFSKKRMERELSMESQAESS